MKLRCATCVSYTPSQGSEQHGWCSNQKSKHGTYVVGQDKGVRPNYGCIWHETAKQEAA